MDEGYDKIKYSVLKAEMAKRKDDGGFFYPIPLKVSLPVIKKCKYCGSLFLTRLITLFFGVGLICNCTKCGGRHKTSYNGLIAYVLLWVFVLLVIFAVALLIVLSCL